MTNITSYQITKNTSLDHFQQQQQLKSILENNVIINLVTFQISRFGRNLPSMQKRVRIVEESTFLKNCFNWKLLLKISTESNTDSSDNECQIFPVWKWLISSLPLTCLWGNCVHYGGIVFIIRDSICRYKHYGHRNQYYMVNGCCRV